MSQRAARQYRLELNLNQDVKPKNEVVSGTISMTPPPRWFLRSGSWSRARRLGGAALNDVQQRVAEQGGGLAGMRQQGTRFGGAALKDVEQGVMRILDEFLVSKFH